MPIDHQVPTQRDLGRRASLGIESAPFERCQASAGCTPGCRGGQRLQTARKARTRSSSEERRSDASNMVITEHDRRALVVARYWRWTKSGPLLGWRAVQPCSHDDSRTQLLRHKASLRETRRQWCARDERTHEISGPQRSVDDSSSERRFALDDHQLHAYPTARRAYPTAGRVEHTRNQARCRSQRAW